MDPGNIAGHDIYFHLRILMGVVLGLALTRMLAGVAKFAQHPGGKPLYAAHLLWVAVVMVMAIHFWWFEFGLIRIQPWPFELFVFVLFYASLFYLMATLLIPDEIGEYADYADYFISRRRWFFGLLALTAPVDLIDTLAKGPAYYHSLGPEYPFRLVGLVVLCAVAVWVKDRRIHIALAAFYLVYFVSWILRSYRVLE
jgi:hypothetical protein